MNSPRVTVALAVYALLAVRCLAAEPSQDVWIYKLDGTIQCDEVQGVPLEVMAEQLKAQGVTVLFRSEKRKLPVLYATGMRDVRGALQTLFSFRASDWTRLENLGTLGFAVWAFDT